MNITYRAYVTENNSLTYNYSSSYFVNAAQNNFDLASNFSALTKVSDWFYRSFRDSNEFQSNRLDYGDPLDQERHLRFLLLLLLLPLLFPILLRDSAVPELEPKPIQEISLQRMCSPFYQHYFSYSCCRFNNKFVLDDQFITLEQGSAFVQSGRFFNLNVSSSSTEFSFDFPWNQPRSRNFIKSASKHLETQEKRSDTVYE